MGRSHRTLLGGNARFCQCLLAGEPKRSQLRTEVAKHRSAKSTHHPHKIDDQHRECKAGGGAYFAFFLGSDNSHTTPQNIPPDGKGLLWGWCVVRKVPVTPTPVFFQKYCRTNGGRTATQMGGVLQCKWEAYCRVFSLSSKLRSQESTAIQMGGVLPYKLEVYCRTF